MCNPISIIVATHKKYRMPVDSMYIPLHVGPDIKSLELGYQKDNTGDNISKLNPFFCELTGLYWAWKNIDSDYIGLVHYRRYFALRKSKDMWDRVLKYDDIKPYLENIRVFVPRRRHYYIETLYSHYSHTFSSEQLDATRSIIADKYPEYVNCYDKVMKCRSGHMFNMMIMERELLDQYCTWLFDILFELKACIDSTSYSSFEKRFCGRVSEIIFNVWLMYQIESNALRKDEIKELPYIYMEKVNWRKKGTAFLKAKFLNSKYSESF